MKLHRYKASFSSQDSTNEFFDSFTWVNYGFWLALILSFFLHGVMYYHPETGYPDDTHLEVIGYNAIGVAVLFVLRLFAINFYIVGLFMAALCYITSIVFLTLMIYISFIGNIPIAYISSVLYFGVAGYLLNKDYKKLTKSTI
jgi:hypothetical protein